MSAADKRDPAKTHLQAGWWEHHQPGHFPALVVLDVARRLAWSSVVDVLLME
jgi:hypothetical protein